MTGGKHVRCAKYRFSALQSKGLVVRSSCVPERQSDPSRKTLPQRRAWRGGRTRRASMQQPCSRAGDAAAVVVSLAVGGW